MNVCSKHVRCYYVSFQSIITFTSTTCTTII